MLTVELLGVVSGWVQGYRLVGEVDLCTICAACHL